MIIEGIILAAGLSSRAGLYKMAVKLGNRHLIEWTVEGMLGICTRIIVVGGYRFERLKPLVSVYPEVRVVNNRNYRLGMFSSVQAGIQYTTGELIFITPGDCPFIKKTTFQKLIDAAMKGEDLLIPVYNGRRGHPVLINGKFREDLLKEPVDSTLRDFIRRKGYHCVMVEDEGILVDIDTPKDIEQTKARHVL